MAQKNCAACDELRNDAPNFVVNGLTNTEIASLKNNTGLNPSNSNNDCTDLNNMNDCLIGNMEEEVELYDVCDWKEYTKELVGNLWTMFAGVIASMCGLWTNVSNILAALRKLQCQVNYLFKGATFRVGEVYDDNTKTHIVAGKGVSFLNVSQSGTSGDIGLVYVAGGLATLAGSCLFYNADFTEQAACYNYDTNAVNPVKTSARKGNPYWVGQNEKPGDASSELVYEIRIRKSEFPQISALYSGIGMNTGGGGYHAMVRAIPEGTYAPGQHGDCNTLTGDPNRQDFDRGHLVPTGWVYLQLRITWIEEMNGSANGSQYSPQALFGIRINQDGLEC